jgi:hypothetical protein
VDNKEQVALLLQALADLRSQHQALTDEIDRQEEEVLLRRWGRRWDRERRERRLLEARN